MIKEYICQDGFKEYQSAEKIALCLGFFDGLHLGHQKLILQALKENPNVGVLTFQGALKRITSAREDEEILTSVEDRKELLEKMGIHSLFVVPFDEKIHSMEAEDFIFSILKPLNVSAVYIGSDFRFGKGAKGDKELLSKYFDVHTVDFRLDEEGKKISTSSIIRLIKNGFVEEADKDLGRNYSIRGKIIHGLRNGSTKLGFPTANISPADDYVIPMKGVYATYLNLEGQRYLSMTDIGVHPTINELSTTSIEVNIFGFEGNVYFENVRLEFLSYLRPETKFASLEELKEQLSRDKTKIILKYKE
ncbi:MAG: riboflavin biosynthesis protein RibF [Bacilli bacterium]|jgi:riboflavin kinase/FMN adenylyltransferase|nr:riboflavin biosynthesis protein RibF [Bacilli bacterium]